MRATQAMTVPWDGPAIPAGSPPRTRRTGQSSRRRPLDAPAPGGRSTALYFAVSSLAMSLHSTRFPGETAEYRAARDELLLAERALTQELWRVAALRRDLPVGGPVPMDYVFEEGPGDLDRDAPTRPVRLS